MSDRPPRPILRLKFPPASMPTATAATAPSPTQPAAGPQWKCKPCGAAFDVDPALADADPVRCPSCNARLGRAEQFRGETAGEGVRARRIGG